MSRKYSRMSVATPSQPGSAKINLVDKRWRERQVAVVIVCNYMVLFVCRRLYQLRLRLSWLTCYQRLAFHQLKQPVLYLQSGFHRYSKWDATIDNGYNKPFPSSLVPLFQNEFKCEAFHMKMSSAWSFIFMQINVIFIRMVSHLDLLWNRGSRELRNSLFCLHLSLLTYTHHPSLGIFHPELFSPKVPRNLTLLLTITLTVISDR